MPSQTNAQQARPKGMPHLLKPHNSTLMLKAQKVPLGREQWGNVVKSTRWDNGTPEYGFYSFGASGSIDINELFTDGNMYANASGAMVGNRLDVIRYNREQNVMYHYLYNATTDACEDVSYLTDFSMWATETAVSADNKVYGVFFTGDAEGTELGIADYANETRTAIGTVSRYYVALGITKDNVLYGNGPKAYVNSFIGDDIPLKPTNVKATVDIKTGKVNLSWTAVTKGINGGYVGDMKYNVVRYPDNKAIATATAATSVSDMLPGGDLTGYYYTVQAISGQRKSESVKSNSISFGDVLEPPYYQNFENANSMNTLTVLDENNDGTTWQFLEDDGSNQSAVSISYAEVDHDDWLVLPALNLKAGVLYNLSYRVATQGTSYPEELEVKYGAEPTAAAMIHEVVSKTEYINQDYVTVKKEIVVDKDQVAYIGFHCTSSADWCYQLVLNNISVVGNSLKAPDAITEISTTAATDGSLKVRIDFTAPSKAIDGTKLTSDMEVKIVRDGEVIQEMGAIEPGQKYYYLDNYAQNGYNYYSVIASNDEGVGRESKVVEAYVGEDTPAKVQNIKYSVDNDVITLTWNPVTTGQHGGYRVARSLHSALCRASLLMATVAAPAMYRLLPRMLRCSVRVRFRSRAPQTRRSCSLRSLHWLTPMARWWFTYASPTSLRSSSALSTTASSTILPRIGAQRL